MLKKILDFNQWLNKTFIGDVSKDHQWSEEDRQRIQADIDRIAAIK